MGMYCGSADGSRFLGATSVGRFEQAGVTLRLLVCARG